MAESTITTVLAVWGALLSTGLMGWTIYRDIRDTGRLKVSCGFRHLAIPGESVEEDVLAYTVTNIGRRPVIVTNVGGTFVKGTGYVTTDPQIPKSLAPGEWFVCLGREHELLFQGIAAIEVFDSLGRRYRAPRKEVAEVNAELNKLQAKGITSSSLRRI